MIDHSLRPDVKTLNVAGDGAEHRLKWVGGVPVGLGGDPLDLGRAGSRSSRGQFDNHSQHAENRSHALGGPARAPPSPGGRRLQRAGGGPAWSTGRDGLLPARVRHGARDRGSARRRGRRADRAGQGAARRRAHHQGDGADRLGRPRRLREGLPACRRRCDRPERRGRHARRERAGRPGHLRERARPRGRGRARPRPRGPGPALLAGPDADGRRRRRRRRLAGRRRPRPRRRLRRQRRRPPRRPGGASTRRTPRGWRTASATPSWSRTTRSAT